MWVIIVNNLSILSEILFGYIRMLSYITYVIRDWGYVPTDNWEMSKVKEFEKSIEGVKFTPAQQKIVNKLLKGYEIEVVNKHHMSGGQMMWKNPNSNNLEHAGKVYTSFFNVFYQIKKQKGIVIPTNLFLN